MVKLERFTKLNNVKRLTKIIFLNFIYLQGQNDIIFSYDEIDKILSSENLIGWFLTNDYNFIIGYLIGIVKRLADGRHVYYVSYFYIVEKYRNNGYGKIMMKTMITHITNINLKYIVLITETNNVAYKIYKNIGFVDDPILVLKNDNFKLLLYYC